MKTRLILFILLFISGFAIAGCKQQNQYRPDAKIVAAFNNKYPQSDKVEWEQKQGYYVAEFRVWVRKTPDNHLIIRGFCFYRAY